jgi:hypothetical protein
MTDLSVFQLGGDLVIAKDIEDALAVWQEKTGEDWREYYTRDDLSLAPKIITITFVEHELKNTKYPPDGKVEMLPDGSFTVRASAEAWAACYGRDFLAGENV